MTMYSSWGNIPRVQQTDYPMRNRYAFLPEVSQKKLLAYGMGRSYGDVCLNEDNIILLTRNLDKFISFDTKKGIVRCESGICLKDLLDLIIPLGYFIPVTPGTKYVSIGGMIANDVHGKNHHRTGSFGCHVNQFELLRSDGTRLICSSSENADFYSATIGGLGLTGLITWVEIKLKPIVSALITEEAIPFTSLSQFISITEDSDQDWEYTVSWIDSLTSENMIGKGVFFRGNHVDSPDERFVSSVKKQVKVPFFFPSWILNRLSLKAFNSFYFSLNKKSQKTVPYTKFFYPLDKVGAWNKIYGRRGFYQYQCVIPAVSAESTLEQLLTVCSNSMAGSFLSVLKKFGSIKSPGILSFPREGYTLALDFPNKGVHTLSVLDKLDEIVMQVGGAVYPAKDARMKPESFKSYFPRWREFSKFIDPAFSSSFWRRVTVE